MNITASLSTLETSGLIRLYQRNPELEYFFRHALVQEAAYDSILKADRKQLHLAVALEMEHAYPERLDELAALLANHYYKAGEKQKAFEYHKHAAQYAFQKFANGEAEYNLRAALELCENESERAVVQHRLGIVLLAAVRLDEAEQFLRAALPDYRANNKLEDLADVYGNLSQIAWAKSDTVNSLVIAREGLQEIGDPPPNAAYAELLRYAASACYYTGVLEEAQTYTTKALAVAEACGAKGALAHALVDQALIEDDLGKSEQAITTLERAIFHAQEVNNFFALTRARNNLGNIYNKLSRNTEAIKQYESAVDINRRTNSISGEILSLVLLNSAYLDFGRINEAAVVTDDLQNLFEASGGKVHSLRIKQTKIMTLYHAGNPAAAITEAISAREEALKHNNKGMILGFSYYLATAYMLVKDYASAAREMKLGIAQAGTLASASDQYMLASFQARSEADISVARETLARADITADLTFFYDITTRLCALMHIRAREENFNEALSIAGELAEKYRAAEFRWYYALTLWDAGEIALKANMTDKAKELLQHALSEYQEMNVPVYAAQIYEILNTL